MYMGINIIIFVYNFVLQRSGTNKKRTTIICCILMFIYEIIEIISPITKFGFYIEDGIAYEHFFLNPFTCFYLFYATSFLICFYVYRKIFPTKTFFYICILTIYVFFIMTTGALLKTTTFNVLTFFLPIIFIYIIFHGEKFNIESGSLGQEAFYSFISSLRNKHKNFTIVSSTFVQNNDLETQKSLIVDLSLICSNCFKQGTMFEKKQKHIKYHY